MAIAVTRSQLNKVWTIVLLFNSVAAVVSTVLFFLSSWWIFILIGIICFPVLVGLFFLFKYTKYREPIQRYALNFVVKTYESIVQKRGAFLRRIYTAVCWFIPSEEWKHINWGYAPLNIREKMLPNLTEDEEEKRFYIQLYHYLVTGMGNWTTLEGKTIMELRAGGAGGLQYVTDHLNPTKSIGIDVSTTQMEKCREVHAGNLKMRFYCADPLESFSKIEELANEKIDVVFTLQSSMHISDFPKFIQEVNSVVKPGGIFAFADLRLAEDWAQLERQLESSSMKVIKREDISQNVIQALKLDELEKWYIINRRLGSLLRKLMVRIGIIKNNAISESLSKGTNKAMAYILHKVPQQNFQ